MPFGHFPSGPGSAPRPPRESADDTLNRLTQADHDLTEADRANLTAGGHGDLIEDIERQQRERRDAGPHVPPWMH